MATLGGAPHKKHMKKRLSRKSSADVIDFEPHDGETYRRGIFPSRQSLIEYGGYRLLITDSPSEFELTRYMTTLKQYNIMHVVRVCEPTYDASYLVDNGFKFHDWSFPDGGVPPPSVIDWWLDLLESVFDSALSYEQGEAVAVHCRGGLGRAPLMVALALIEQDMDALQAIGTIRIKRRGAINSRQVEFLGGYVQRQKPLSAARKGRSLGSGIFSSARSKIFRLRDLPPKIDEVSSPCSLSE